LVDRLDQVADWGRILSLGEQQRLAFGRLLLSAPAAAFLGEATSAMDEGLEDAMYRLVREQLPHIRLVSVVHRSTLAKHHACQLIMKGKGTSARVLAGISGAATVPGPATIAAGRASLAPPLWLRRRSTNFHRAPDFPP